MYAGLRLFVSHGPGHRGRGAQRSQARLALCLLVLSAALCCNQASDFLSGMGLGMVADQLKDLKLGELLETPPPGLDEAVAIAKVVQFVNSQVSSSSSSGGSLVGTLLRRWPLPRWCSL